MNRRPLSFLILALSLIFCFFFSCNKFFPQPESESYRDISADRV